MHDQKPATPAATPLVNLIWKELDLLEDLMKQELIKAKRNPGKFSDLGRQAQQYSVEINALRGYLMLTQMK